MIGHNIGHSIVHILFTVEGFLLVNEDTLVNSWNFGEENLPTTTVWHGNEHAMNVTLENLESLETDPQEIMRSMLGILQAFQFLENVLLSENPSKTIETSTSAALQPPPPLIVERPKGMIYKVILISMSYFKAIIYSCKIRQIFPRLLQSLFQILST